MTKSELVSRLSKRYPHLLKRELRTIVDIMFATLSDALKNEQRIEIRGFGSFSVRKRKPRMARNPKTNEVVYLSERPSVYFRSGKELKELLNS